MSPHGRAHAARPSLNAKQVVQQASDEVEVQQLSESALDVETVDRYFGNVIVSQQE